jgi:hypothetical protein
MTKPLNGGNSADCEGNIESDSHIDHGDDDDASGRPATRADILIDLAKEAELFHDAKGIGYADIQNQGHRETWPIRSTEFKQWLIHRFYKATGGSPNSEAVQAALGAIGAMARYEAPERSGVCSGR